MPTNQNKFISINTSGKKEELAGVTAGGAGNANSMAQLDSNGQWALSMMPTGIGPDVSTIIVATGYTTAAGEFVGLDGSGEVIKASAASGSIVEPIGFVKDVVVGNGVLTVDVYHEGIATVAGASYTPGDRLYLDPANDGDPVATVPTGTGEGYIPLGFAITATTINTEIQECVTRA